MKMYPNNFKQAIVNTLQKFDIEEDQINEFLNNSIDLSELGFCLNYCIMFDNELSNIFPGWKGCIYTDTFDDIYEYNKDIIPKQ